MLKKTNGYWIFERCKDEALMYNTRSEFNKKSTGAYLKSLKMGWLDEFCSHMFEFRKPRNYWTKEKCRKEALKYEHRVDFQKKSGTAYVLCRTNNWLDEFCSHMEILGDLYKRCIYAYEFPDNSVYVGLTFNVKKRNKDRKTKKNDGVTKHISETGLQPKIIQLTDYIDVKSAIIKEGEYEKKYKDEGWTILNIAKTGSIGGGFKIWTKEICQIEALKYNTKKEFRENNGKAYNASYDHEWLNEICSHMKKMINVKGYWTKEKCQEESLKYNIKEEFRKYCSAAYGKACDNKWIDEICSHMSEIKKPRNYWTKERCHKEALKYKTRTEFQNESTSAYNKSLKNKWLCEICSHMEKIYWTKEKCREESLKYTTRTEFQKKSHGAYYISLKNKWLDEICHHMIEINKSRGYWIKERCYKESLKYKTRTEFQKKSVGAYTKSLKNKWLDEFFNKQTRFSIS